MSYLSPAIVHIVRLSARHEDHHHAGRPLILLGRLHNEESKRHRHDRGAFAIDYGAQYLKGRHDGDDGEVLLGIPTTPLGLRTSATDPGS
jgi:hypothetical protein